MADKPLPPPPLFEKDSASISESKPDTPRRATAPESGQLTSHSNNGAMTTLPIRPRTRSPYSRGHARSRSSGSALKTPQMSRANSSPGPESSRRALYQRPASPNGPFARHSSPLRKPMEDFSSFGSNIDIDQTIVENAELEVTPRATLDFEHTPMSPSISHNTFPRSRRRPASPLSQLQQVPLTPRAPLRASISTPSLANSQFNEQFPSSLSMSTSSASTPTSMRSRSPSISSLETIPDSPDAEREAEQIARLKAAADREEKSEEGVRRRLSFSDGGSRSMRDKRKRWSVCGAEGRGDLNLDTIYEDGG